MFITVRKITNKLDIAQIKDLFKSNIYHKSTNAKQEKLFTSQFSLYLEKD